MITKKRNIPIFIDEAGELITYFEWPELWTGDAGKIFRRICSGAGGSVRDRRTALGVYNVHHNQQENDKVDRFHKHSFIVIKCYS
jgi:hypothetical protein